MTPQQISQDIELCIEQRRIVKDANVKIKAAEKRLEQAGLEGDQIPLQEPDREGRQFLARCPKLGIVVPVIFESDQIIASIEKDTVAHHSISQAAGPRFPDFFALSTKYARVHKEGLEFRRHARKVFESAAPDFISLCIQRDKDGIPKSRTIIAWDNARPIDQ